MHMTHDWLVISRQIDLTAYAKTSVSPSEHSGSAIEACVRMFSAT
jgi:hypothetical protein